MRLTSYAVTLLAVTLFTPAPAAHAVEPDDMTQDDAARILATPADDYQLAGLRDPFRAPPVISLGRIDVPPPPPPSAVDGCAAATQLSKVSIDEIELKAISEGTNGRRALVSSVAGRGAVLAEGDHVGRECARVVRVEDGQLLLAIDVADEVLLVVRPLRASQPGQPGDLERSGKSIRSS